MSEGDSGLIDRDVFLKRISDKLVDLYHMECQKTYETHRILITLSAVPKAADKRHPFVENPLIQLKRLEKVPYFSFNVDCPLCQIPVGETISVNGQEDVSATISYRTIPCIDRATGYEHKTVHLTLSIILSMNCSAWEVEYLINSISKLLGYWLDTYKFNPIKKGIKKYDEYDIIFKTVSNKSKMIISTPVESSNVKILDEEVEIMPTRRNEKKIIGFGGPIRGGDIKPQGGTRKFDVDF